MKVVFRVLSVACLLAIGGCGISATQSPEWKASVYAKTYVEMITMQRDAVRKYDSWNEADAAYWAAMLAAAEQLDKNQISKRQYDAISEDAYAARIARKNAEDAAYYARRSASRGYYCQRSGSGSYCY